MDVTQWLSVCFVLASLWCHVRAERVLGKVTDEFDFDGLPGAQHEFKVEIGPGREDCYYQSIGEGAHLYVSYEVLRGGDGELVLFMVDPEYSTIVQNTEVGPRGGFTYQSPATKTYALCLDNRSSMMSSKLVYFYLVTYLEEEWSQYSQELADLQLTVANFSSFVNHVQESVTAALVHQAESRMHVVHDWYLVLGNHDYVQRWSLAQCILVVGASCLQVFFVRRLFRNVNVIPKRPKA